MGKKRGRPRASYTLAKWAFDEVFGDPFAQPEPKPGQYQTNKGRASRGLLRATKCNFDEGKSTRNPAAPNVVDFCCDVERVLETTLDEDELTRFIAVYVEENDASALNADQRYGIEYRLGARLRECGICPVSRYFNSKRRHNGK